MNKQRRLTVLFGALLSGGLVAAEPPSERAWVAPKAPGAAVDAFAWEWVLVLPQQELGSSDWHAWVASDQIPRKTSKFRGRAIPGATVEVFDRFLDERQERILEFNTTWAPVLARSFQLGWRNSYNYEVLGEFMSMTAANLRAPTVPSVFYNGLVPYWIQQGWESPTKFSTGSSGVVVTNTVTNTAADRPMILYPGKR